MCSRDDAPPYPELKNSRTLDERVDSLERNVADHEQAIGGLVSLRKDIPIKLVDHSPEFRAGYQRASDVVFGREELPVFAFETPDFIRGYEVASEKLSGGHSTRYKPNVLLAPETVEQLIDILSEMLTFPTMPPRRAALSTANMVLPHLKLALYGEDPGNTESEEA